MSRLLRLFVTPALTLAAALSLSLLPSVAAHAQIPPSPQATADLERMKDLRAQAKTLREEAEATYQATEPGCYAKFLVNRCIDQAKKARLETIQQARALESEARSIDLTERQRIAAMIREGWPEGEPMPAPTPDLELPPAVTPQPSPDISIDPGGDSARIRAEREAAAADAARREAAARASRDAERAVDRSRAEAEAARRAEAAARDRARYDERIRKFEEEQAQPK